MESYHVPETFCLACNKPVDAAGPVSGGRAPQAGDVSICFYCHHVSIYGDDMTPRDPTDEEIIDMAGDPELVGAINLLGRFKSAEGQKK